MSLRVIPRNWAPKGKRLAKADVLLVSIPKSGRTWLRFMVRHYLCGLGNVPFSIDTTEGEPRHTPRLVCSHDLWEHVTAPRMRDRVRGKYLIPPRTRRTAKVVIAVRDLRDVMVSLHLQLTRRGFHSGARYQGDLSSMIRDRRFGAERAAAILDHWVSEWCDSGRCLVWDYEAAREDPETSLRGVLEFLGCGLIDPDLVKQSVEFASFEHMQSMESENRFGRKLLQPGNPDDPESFKVRRGKVGGYVDYLSREDARFIEAAAARISLSGRL